MNVPEKLEFPLVVKDTDGDEHEVERLVYRLERDDKSRWAEMFGTPERAARTICRQLKHFNICICDGCPVKPPNKECDSEYNTLLVWLESEVVE